MIVWLTIKKADLILSTELLSLHVVRSPNFSTIISYHPTGVEHRATAAASMHARMHSVGSSVYWSRIFKEGKDPTFVVLSLLWYAVYAWDEAMEKLYAHICFLVRTRTFVSKATMCDSWFSRNQGYLPKTMPIWLKSYTWSVLISYTMSYYFAISRALFCLYKILHFPLCRALNCTARRRDYEVRKWWRGNVRACWANSKGWRPVEWDMSGG